MTDELNRHAQRKAATHQKMLDAAQDLIARRGYVKVDVSDITEHANVSRGTFYQHFANKEACVRELVQRGFESLIQEILEVLSELAWSAPHMGIGETAVTTQIEM